VKVKDLGYSELVGIMDASLACMVSVKAHGLVFLLLKNL